MSDEMQIMIDAMKHDQKVRRTITRKNHLLFFSVYFSHYIQHEFADFHREMFELSASDSIQTLVVTAARGIGKSTILNMSLAIWSILGTQKKKYVIISSHTQAKARQHYINLKKELEENTLLKHDLGPFKEENNEWGSSLFLPYYNARVTFVSTEQSIRGMRHKQYRPDLIIADDLDDNESVKTFDGRKKTYDWLTKDVIPAGDKSTRLIVIGTLLHMDSVIIRFKNEIAAGIRAGVYREYPLVDANGVILWKAKYPDMTAIEDERMRIGNDKAWAQEFLLRIVSDHERVVHPEWVQHGEAPQPTNANVYRGTFICTGLVRCTSLSWYQRGYHRMDGM